MNQRPAKARLRRKVGLVAGLPITIEQPRNCGAEQQAVIALVAGTLFVNLSNKVTYDHVKLTIPKSDVPLDYRNHRYDVACLVGNKVILVDVVSVNVRYWKQAGVTQHGKAQE